MKKTLALLTVATVCLTSTGDLAAAEDNARQTTCPYVTLTGTDSHVKQRCYYRVTSEDEWIKIWQRHKGVKESTHYDHFHNLLGLPTVDFEKCVVIAIFQGSGLNSAGLKVDAVLDEESRIVLRFDDKGYQTGGSGGGGKQTTTYGFFVLPRSSKTVVLEENVSNMRDLTPKWQERIRLPE